ncbi:MAG: 2-succinyl-6-hydroxy-2,4-cyclohexadiene-1-carboxylate synthase [Chloroflexi bacterium]|nr:2-succinyl-6-hydroxy-2,4-cyclohexadiene-1-carboxylate synthase [Chloroflexota bacterium]
MALDTLSGLSLNLVQRGAGPAVVALHGFTGDASSWDSFSRAARHEYSVVSVDLPGHGASDAPVNPALYRAPHTVRELAELLDRLHLERVHWLGYSMGARIALAAAIRLGERTSSLVLESASPGLRAVEERQARMRNDEALANRIEKEGVEAFVDYWESLPLWASQARLPRAVRERLRTQRLKNSPAGLANSLRGTGTGAQPSLHDRLGELRVPVLLIAGEEDVKFSAAAREMHRAVPGSRLCIVPGSGHTVHLEQPDTFNRAVLDFLRTVGRSDTPGFQTGSRPNP